MGNYAARFYVFAMTPVRALQQQLETTLFDRVHQVERFLMDEVMPKLPIFAEQASTPLGVVGDNKDVNTDNGVGDYRQGDNSVGNEFGHEDNWKNNVDAGEKSGEKDADKEKAKDDKYEDIGNKYYGKYGGTTWSQVGVPPANSIIGSDEVINLLTSFTVLQGQDVVQAWKALFPQILASYRDGYVVNTTVASITVNKIFYPKWWLDAVGYFAVPPNNDPNLIVFSANPFATGSVSTTFWVVSMVLAVIASAYVSSILTYRRLKREDALKQ